jgi:hypothetical protein
MNMAVFNFGDIEIAFLFVNGGQLLKMKPFLIKKPGRYTTDH